jgi:hypothetical protein
MSTAWRFADYEMRRYLREESPLMRTLFAACMADKDRRVTKRPKK